MQSKNNRIGLALPIQEILVVRWHYLKKGRCSRRRLKSGSPTYCMKKKNIFHSKVMSKPMQWHLQVHVLSDMAVCEDLRELCEDVDGVRL